MATYADLIDFLASTNTDSNGDPFSGYVVATYETDGTTPKAVWEDRDKTLPTGAGKSQFTLDAEGVANVYGDGVYTVKIFLPGADTGVDSPVETKTWSNAITTSDFLSSTPTAGSGALWSGIRPIDIRFYGGLTQTTVNSALSANDSVFFPAGEYPPIIISQSNKNIYFDAGVIFKIPDNTIGALDTSAAACLEVNGANNSFFGDFTCNGNNQNQNISGFTTSNRDGVLRITGSGNKFYGTCKLNNAYYRALQVDDLDAGTGVSGYINAVEVTNSYEASAFLWGIDGLTIDKFLCRRGAQTSDMRIRFGTNNVTTSTTENIYIGEIDTDDTVVFEVNSYHIHVNRIKANNGKIEGIGTASDYLATDINIGSIFLNDTIASGEYYGWAFNGCDNCYVGSIVSTGHSPSVNREPIFMFKTKNTKIGKIFVTGNGTTSPDVSLLDFSNVVIDSITAIDPASTSAGVNIPTDAAYTQDNLKIGHVYSFGHSTDIIFRPVDATVTIGKWNSDAVTSGEILSTTSFPGIHCASFVSIAAGVATPSATSINVATVSTASTGAYTVNFSNTLPNTTRMVATVSPFDNGTVIGCRVQSISGSNMQVRFFDAAGNLTEPDGFFVKIEEITVV